MPKTPDRGESSQRCGVGNDPRWAARERDFNVRTQAKAKSNRQSGKREEREEEDGFHIFNFQIKNLYQGGL
jgi:hypothetical protein